MSHDLAKAQAEGEYEQFHTARLEQSNSEPSDFDRAIAQLPRPAPKRKQPKKPEKP